MDFSSAGRIKTEAEEFPNSENEGEPAFIAPFLTEMITHPACRTSLSRDASFVRHVLVLYSTSAQGTDFCFSVIQEERNQTWQGIS